jgi:Protein of unknown function (DUF2637)
VASWRLTSDRSVLRMRTGAVLAVAAIAAWISYMHIADLAAAHGQAQLAAHLLPLSVDGTVAAASLDMIVSVRARQSPGWLTRTFLGLGVAATLAANIASGWPHGPVDAAASGWPAVGFIGCVEMAIRSLRRQARARPAAADAATAAARAGQHRGRSGRAPVTVTAASLAAQQGVSPRTARRRLAALREPAEATR